jgi:PAS domain S-box-containing protein
MILKEGYKLLFESLPFPILLTDKEDVIIDVNPAFEKILGYESKELIGKTYEDANFISRKYLRILKERKQKQIKGISLHNIEIQLKKKKGQKIWGCFNSSLIKIDDKVIVQNIGFDITDYKKAEQELIKSYDRASFYKDLILHDMKNVLQNINNALELYSLYQKQNDKKNQINELIKILEDQAKRGTSLILNVSKLSKIEESEIPIKKVEVIQILNESIDFIHKSYPAKEIKIKVTKQLKEYYVKANELLLDVFENLLINSIKHNENPVIEIQIKLSIEQKGKKELLKVQFIDNAKGIPDTLKEKIFQRTKPRVESVSGKGLGLSLVKFIIDSYKGNVSVENRIRGDYTKGSNFIVFLPKIA